VSGLVKTAALERPELRVCHVDLEASPLAEGLARQLARLVAGGVAVPALEVEVALRGDVAYVPRLVQSGAAYRGPLELALAERGALSNLRLRPLSEPRASPGKEEVVVRVRAVGLNFRDVLNVMGLYPGEPGPPGSDCSGTVVAVGEGVRHVRVGDEVYGCVPGCLRTFARGPAALVQLKPRTLSFEEAAAMPTVCATVDVALVQLAKLQRGERVLVHAAAGGVGLAAVQLAQSLGAVVYATAGSDEKHAYLRSLGVQYITSSRDADVFRRDMTELLGGQRLDVVLNSLSGDFIAHSLALLGPKGRFMEIGKRDIWTHERMASERPDVHYEAIALDDMMARDPGWYALCLRALAVKADKGEVRPPPTRVFDLEREHVEGLRCLQLGQNIGKVVLALPSSLGPALRADATYIITGGLGALGLVFARALVEEGARHVVLVSRRGEAAAAGLADVQRLQESAARVEVVQCDVSDLGSVRAMLSAVGQSMPAVRGVLHCAGVLDDAMLENQTVERFERVVAGKVSWTRVRGSRF
jgi:NADPH:quinone reductase-like Zn-dependent oxidoreductase